MQITCHIIYKTITLNVDGNIWQYNIPNGVFVNLTHANTIDAWILKVYYAQFLLKKLDCNCYIFQNIVIYNDE